MNMAYVKKRCYVVYGAYRDDPDYPIGSEEEICFSEREALAKAEEMRQDYRFEDVTLEEEIREFYVRRSRTI